MSFSFKTMAESIPEDQMLKYIDWKRFMTEHVVPEEFIINTLIPYWPDTTDIVKHIIQCGKIKISDEGWMAICTNGNYNGFTIFKKAECYRVMLRFRTVSKELQQHIMTTFGEQVLSDYVRSKSFDFDIFVNYLNNPVTVNSLGKTIPHTRDHNKNTFDERNSLYTIKQYETLMKHYLSKSVVSHMVSHAKCKDLELLKHFQPTIKKYMQHNNINFVFKRNEYIKAIDSLGNELFDIDEMLYDCIRDQSVYTQRRETFKQLSERTVVNWDKISDHILAGSFIDEYHDKLDMNKVYRNNRRNKHSVQIELYNKLQQF